MTEEKLNIERVIIEEVIKMESKELGELFTALGKAQGEMKVAKANVVNSYFKSKYADLTSIVNASRPALSKYGLSIIQRVLDGEKDTQWLYTRLCHASGQWMESKMKINPPKADIQSMGSYLTYLKRYNMASIIGCTAGEEDDDGESAMKESRDIDTVAKSNPNITKAQLQVLSKELEGYEEILESLLKGYNIEKLSEIPAKTYSSCLDRIRNIKKAKDINNG